MEESEDASFIDRVRKAKCSARLWQILAVGFGLLWFVMTILFVWHAVTYTVKREAVPKWSDNAEGTINERTKRIFGRPCPQVPSALLSSHDPMPDEINKTLLDLEELMEGMINDSTLQPAISANIFYRGSVIWSAHYGSKRYKDKDAKPDDNTVYRIGSVTKIFPVLLIYKLYESGLIASVDDPLSKYAPDFGIKNPFTKENITLREIASQMSGLPREAPCKFHCNGTDSQEQLNLLRNMSLVVPPWVMPSYSNLGYVLLGRLLTENLLNTTFENWVKNEILEPLDMTNTGFTITRDVEKNMALPFSAEGKRIPFMDIAWANPAGGMYSTVSDLAKLGMMFTQPSKHEILKPSTIREMSLPVEIAPDGHTVWGAPFEMFLADGFLVRGKGGNIDTYGAHFTFEPQLALGMNVLISNVNLLQSSGRRSLEISEKAYYTVLPALNKTLFDLQKSASFPVSPMPFTGVYSVNATNPFTLSTTSYLAKISVDQMFLRLDTVNPSPFASFVKIKYIGNPLMFQAFQYTPGMSCFSERIGLYADMYFAPPKADGLSDSFSVPGWSVVGKRVSENGRKTRKTQTGGNIFDKLFQPEFFTP